MCNTFLLLRAALGILSCGIYEASERSLVSFMEGVLVRLVDNQATLLADWLLVEGGV
jgi:hypothetical protein